MPAQMISYDLSKPSQKYAELRNAIKALGSAWWHHLDSTWIVVTSKSSRQVVESLRPHLDVNDKLLVTRLSGSWTSWGLPEEAVKWLHNNL